VRVSDDRLGLAAIWGLAVVKGFEALFQQPGREATRNDAGSKGELGWNGAIRMSNTRSEVPRRCFTLRLPEELWDFLCDGSAVLNLSRNELICDAIRARIPEFRRMMNAAIEAEARASSMGTGASAGAQGRDRGDGNT
jgi:hypothetical protein